MCSHNCRYCALSDKFSYIGISWKIDCVTQCATKHIETQEQQNVTRADLWATSTNCITITCWCSYLKWTSGLRLTTSWAEGRGVKHLSVYDNDYNFSLSLSPCLLPPSFHPALRPSLPPSLYVLVSYLCPGLFCSWFRASICLRWFPCGAMKRDREGREKKSH